MNFKITDVKYFDSPKHYVIEYTALVDNNLFPGNVFINCSELYTDDFVEIVRKRIYGHICTRLASLTETERHLLRKRILASELINKTFTI